MFLKKAAKNRPESTQNRVQCARNHHLAKEKFLKFHTVAQMKRMRAKRAPPFHNNDFLNFVQFLKFHWSSFSNNFFGLVQLLHLVGLGPFVGDFGGLPVVMAWV
jgi:hypothetical protein